MDQMIDSSNKPPQTIPMQKNVIYKRLVVISYMYIITIYIYTISFTIYLLSTNFHI